MVRRYRSGWWLEQKYHGEGMTQREIAEECGVSARTIRTWTKRRGVETRDLTGLDHPLHGTERDEEVKTRISETLSGRELSEEARQSIGEANSRRDVEEETRRRIAESLSGIERSEETRRRMSESTSGPANPNWRGGSREYYGAGWAEARQTVLERDEVCQNCGRGPDCVLDVHHIVPVRLFRESDAHDISAAHDPSNLVVLCKRCHGLAEHDKIQFESGIDSPGVEK